MSQTLIRFVVVEYHSCITMQYHGKRNLPYTVVSLAILPRPEDEEPAQNAEAIPEIFWQ